MKIARSVLRRRDQGNLYPAIRLKNGSVHTYGGPEVVTEEVIEEVFGLQVMIGTIRGITCIVPGLCSPSGK